MRRRNQFLALVLLALFAASGVLYFHVFVQPPKAFGIILFVGEGLVTSKLTAARLYDGGAGHRLAMDSLSHTALLHTSAADSAVPDAAAAASAFSCGAKVNRGALCVDPAGRQFRPLLQLAADHHRATGLITTGRLTDPTPAAFYAVTADCRERDALEPQLFIDPRLQVILGGGAADFLPKSKGGHAPEGESIVDSVVSAKLYKLLRTPADLQATFGAGPARLLGLFTPEAMPFRDQVQAGGVSRPGLPEMVAAAIDTLQRQRNGYVLVVDAGLVERASLENQAERALQELIELDRAVAVALRYAGPQSLVIVAGGQSIGGLSRNAGLPGQDPAAKLPAFTWATGPAGPAPDASPAAAPAAFYLPAAANVADDAVAAASGPGSEELQGFKENTFVFDLIREQL